MISTHYALFTQSTSKVCSESRRWKLHFFRSSNFPLTRILSSRFLDKHQVGLKFVVIIYKSTYKQDTPGPWLLRILVVRYVRKNELSTKLANPTKIQKYMCTFFSLKKSYRIWILSDNFYWDIIAGPLGMLLVFGIYLFEILLRM